MISLVKVGYWLGRYCHEATSSGPRFGQSLALEGRTMPSAHSDKLQINDVRLSSRMSCQKSTV